MLHFGAERLRWLSKGSRYHVCISHVLLQELVVETVEGQFQTVGDSELVVDLAQVVLDDLFGGADLVGDLFVAHAAGDAADDRELFLGELGLDLGVGEAGGLRTVGFDDPANGLIVDPGFAVGDLAHALDQQIGGDGARDDAPDAAAVEFYGVGLVGLGDLDDELGAGGLADQFGDGVDGAGDELAFKDDDVGGVALQGGVEVGEGLDLRDDADVVFESEDLAHADAIDRLGVGQDDPDARGCCSFFGKVLGYLRRVEMDNRHSSGL
jgi:hypothetical protein